MAKRVFLRKDQSPPFSLKRYCNKLYLYHYEKWGDTPLFCIAYIWHSFQFSILDIPKTRVAEVGSLLVRAKMVIKTFIKQVFTIFATNVCFFVRKCKLANLIQCNMRYIQCNSALLAKEALFLTKKGTCFVQSTGSPPHQKWTAS